MNNDQYLLASAYLDGELTDEERRIADRDPDVMSIVADLAALHATLNDVPPADPSVKRASIAAAMAEFNPSSSDLTTPVPGRSRPTRLLALAAAVVAIGAIGVVAASVINSGADDASSGASESAEIGNTGANTEDAAVAPEASGAADGNRASADDSTQSLVTALAATDDADDIDPRNTAPPSDMAGSDSADSDSAESEGADNADVAGDEGAVDDATAQTNSTPYQSIEPVTDPDAPLTTPGQLTGYGFYLLERVADGTIGPTVETECMHPGSIGDINILDTATYLLDGVAQQVFVAVDEVSGQAFAIDQVTCEVLVEGTEP